MPNNHNQIIKTKIFIIGPEDSFGKRLTDEDITNSVYDVRACSFGAIHCIQCDSVKEALSLYPEEYDKIKYDLRLAFDITRQVSRTLFLMNFNRFSV